MSAVESYDRKLLLENAAERAIDLAEYSAINNGKDIPVGAIALFGAAIAGSGYAMDGESGIQHMHAEIVSLEQAMHTPDTVVTTMEPCEQCQDRMAEIESIKTVAYVTPRTELSDRLLVNPRPSINERIARYELPYRVIRLSNPALLQRALEPLEFTSRDLLTGTTDVDSEGFRIYRDARNLRDIGQS
ncbi:MAG: Cytidine and deoxycytidylate deaminase zinc-binding region [Candidatus Saccharibacteria bacterium]|nr:Cytidine and deoxycytidylate deaminase zinc-binding region [Candidatus Saccharibacteria bacterium]